MYDYSKPPSEDQVEEVVKRHDADGYSPLSNPPWSSCNPANPQSSSYDHASAGTVYSYNFVYD